MTFAFQGNFTQPKQVPLYRSIGSPPLLWSSTSATPRDKVAIFRQAQDSVAIITSISMGAQGWVAAPLGGKLSFLIVTTFAGARDGKKTSFSVPFSHP